MDDDDPYGLLALFGTSMDKIIGPEETRHLRPNPTVVVKTRDEVRAMFCGKHADAEAAAYIARMADAPYVKVV